MRSNFAGPVNIGSEEMITIDGLAGLIMQIAGKQVEKRHVPGPTAHFWWRDDDAVSDTPELRRLIDVARGFDIVAGLAVIPENADSSLARLVSDAPLCAWQHGWGHHYHADGNLDRAAGQEERIEAGKYGRPVAKGAIVAAAKVGGRVNLSSDRSHASGLLTNAKSWTLASCCGPSLRNDPHPSGEGIVGPPRAGLGWQCKR